MRRDQGEPALAVGIGLHFGPVVLGNIGDMRRVEFAVLGDTVNIASRLEALTRGLRTPLIASHALVARALAEVGEEAIGEMRRYEPVTIRGRSETVDVWTLPGGEVSYGKQLESSSVPLVA